MEDMSERSVGQAQERAVAEMIGYRLSEHAPKPRGERSIGQAERADAPEIGYDWLDRIGSRGLLPEATTERLSDLAEFCELAQAHPEYVTEEGALRWVGNRLRALVAEVDG